MGGREHREADFMSKNEYKVEYRIVGKGGRIIWVSDIWKEDKVRRRKRCHDQYYDRCL